MRDEVLRWDQGATTCKYHTKAVNSAVHDATHMLEGLLYQESYPIFEEHHPNPTEKSRSRGCPCRLNKTVRTGECLPCAPLRRIHERGKKAAEQGRKATVAIDEPYRFSFGTNRVHSMHLNKVMCYQIFFDASILS
ncbi:hypothetical protein [Burkholderia sp. MSMB1078WGS]|uniref:hypothetical protein n=1 Tax=Burkholderia sp. MSMB1078WGS TaxID=1637900 RepID=UPI000A8D1BD0|nr:hypothetical protein [Burkholderia sp. MSMB1078WGS]